METADDLPAGHGRCPTDGIAVHAGLWHLERSYDFRLSDSGFLRLLLEQPAHADCRSADGCFNRLGREAEVCHRRSFSLWNIPCKKIVLHNDHLYRSGLYGHYSALFVPLRPFI